MLQDRPTELQMHADPIALFGAWMKQATNAPLRDPNAFVLSTVDEHGHPSGRVLLCKELTEDGFIFYTNYVSHKGQDLLKNPNCAATFFWDPLHRQVRLEGSAKKISAEKSDQYWASRARASQLSQVASKQSQTLANRAEMEDKIRQLEDQFKDQAVPRPEHWGGYLFRPEKIEFWVGREGRFHDRLLFTKDGGTWKENWLYP